MQTKSFYIPDTRVIQQSQPVLQGLGYSFDIPWNDVYSTGWNYAKPDVWGMENVFITKPNPEYYAPDGLIRSNYIPSIDVNDPVYHFRRSDHTLRL